MFVDASAMVAVLTREPEADGLADLLESARSPITSPVAIFETVLGICRKRRISVEDAERSVDEFLTVSRIQCILLTGMTHQGRWRRFRGMAKDGNTRPNSTWAIVLPTRSRRITGRRCCSKGKILTRPTFELPGEEAEGNPSSSPILDFTPAVPWRPRTRTAIGARAAHRTHTLSRRLQSHPS